MWAFAIVVCEVAGLSSSTSFMQESPVPRATGGVKWVIVLIIVACEVAGPSSSTSFMPRATGGVEWVLYILVLSREETPMWAFPTVVSEVAGPFSSSTSCRDRPCPLQRTVGVEWVLAIILELSREETPMWALPIVVCEVAGPSSSKHFM